MARTNIQTQRMQMRMRLPLKHITRYEQHLSEARSEPCEISEMEPLAKKVDE